MKKYDIGAFIWPAYTGDERRTRMFWPEGYGEWQTVKMAKPLFEGHTWPRKPLWGYVNEADPYVMEMQIEAAADHGVNVFIYDWYWYDNRPFLENCLNDGYLKAKNNDKVKFCLMWANHTANTLWDKRITELLEPIWDGAVNKETFDFICDRTIQNYFSHPSYYRINDKPVYMIYDVHNLVRGLGGAKKAEEALWEFKKKAADAGYNGIELIAVATSGDSTFDDNTLVEDFLSSPVFDGVTHYQFCQMTDVNRDYPSCLEDAKKVWEEYAEKTKDNYYPQVSVGWDSTPRYNSLARHRILKENTPENVKKAFEAVKEFVDAHPNMKAPFITVNSWNEWTEGSYLEPDDLYGYGYLKAIQDVFMKK